MSGRKGVQGPARAARSARRRRLGPVRSESGQGLVEFLLVIPFLVLLVFGIIEFGAAWRAYQVVTNTAREGARAAVLPSSTYAGTMAVVNGHLSGGGLDPADATVEILCTAGTDATCFPASTGEGTEVRISYPYTFIFLGPIVNYIGWSGGGFGTVTMQTGIVMRNE